jgi:twitching motility two-component system response regulator PilH
MRRILLVEDSRTQAYVTSKVLERNGYEVIVAANGEEGVNLAKNHSPDLVIMDVVMPGAGGYRATREIANSKETEKIPVVMMSAKDQITDKIWALRQGAMGYLVKPVKERELLDTINNLLGFTSEKPAMTLEFF